MQPKLQLIGLPVVLVILAAAAFFIWQSKQAPSSPSSTAPVVSRMPKPTADLGSALYDKISNPVSGKLPSTFAPIANPANSFYKNPFQ